MELTTPVPPTEQMPGVLDPSTLNVWAPVLSVVTTICEVADQAVEAGEGVAVVPGSTAEANGETMTLVANATASTVAPMTTLAIPALRLIRATYYESL